MCSLVLDRVPDFRDAGLPKRSATHLATAIVAMIEGGFVLARAQRDASVLRVLGIQMEKLTADAFDAAKLKR
jgi:hypothetical protein